MSVLVAKLIQLIYGDFYFQKQDESKQKRPPWQEVVFSVAKKLGRLSPPGRRFGPKDSLNPRTVKDCL